MDGILQILYRFLLQLDGLNSDDRKARIVQCQILSVFAYFFHQFGKNFLNIFCYKAKGHLLIGISLNTISTWFELHDLLQSSGSSSGNISFKCAVAGTGIATGYIIKTSHEIFTSGSRVQGQIPITIYGIQDPVIVIIRFVLQFKSMVNYRCVTGKGAVI